MKERLLSGWTFMRMVRAAFAVMFLIAAFTRQEPVAWFAAAFFGLQAVFNIGCCGVDACQPVRNARPASELERPVTYEEIR